MATGNARGSDPSELLACIPRADGFTNTVREPDPSLSFSLSIRRDSDPFTFLRERVPWTAPSPFYRRRDISRFDVSVHATEPSCQSSSFILQFGLSSVNRGTEDLGRVYPCAGLQVASYMCACVFVRVNGIPCIPRTFSPALATPIVVSLALFDLGRRSLAKERSERIDSKEPVTNRCVRIQFACYDRFCVRWLDRGHGRR